MTADESPWADAPERELMRSSDIFLFELSRIDGMEHRKRGLSSRDDERVRLAREIEDATVNLVGLSRYQTRMIELQRQSFGTIESKPRKAAVILDEWRAAERALRDARQAMEIALDDAERLRGEHRRTVGDATG